MLQQNGYKLTAGALVVVSEVLGVQEIFQGPNLLQLLVPAANHFDHICDFFVQQRDSGVEERNIGLHQSLQIKVVYGQDFFLGFGNISVICEFFEVLRDLLRGQGANRLQSEHVNHPFFAYAALSVLFSASTILASASVSAFWATASDSIWLLVFTFTKPSASNSGCSE